MEPDAVLTSLHSDDTALHLRKRELCILASNDNVTVEDNLRASAIRAAVDGSNHGLGGGESSGEGCETVDLGDDVGLVTLCPALSLPLIPSANTDLRSVQFM